MRFSSPMTPLFALSALLAPGVGAPTYGDAYLQTYTRIYACQDKWFANAGITNGPIGHECMVWYAKLGKCYEIIPSYRNAVSSVRTEPPDGSLPATCYMFESIDCYGRSWKVEYPGDGDLTRQWRVEKNGWDDVNNWGADNIFASYLCMEGAH